MCILYWLTLRRSKPAPKQCDKTNSRARNFERALKHQTNKTRTDARTYERKDKHIFSTYPMLRLFLHKWAQNRKYCIKEGWFIVHVQAFHPQRYGILKQTAVQRLILKRVFRFLEEKISNVMLFANSKDADQLGHPRTDHRL